MSREQSYSAIILKKQPYGEGDEIVTAYAKEAGKVRALAKSTKFSKSKLQYGLQVLFLVNLRLSAGALPRVIGVEVVRSFASIRDSLEAINISLYAVELLIKFTPDEHKNEQLFNLFTEFFSFLEKYAKQPDFLPFGLAKFKIHFLETLGLTVHYSDKYLEEAEVGFSNSLGGFTDRDSIDYAAVSREAVRAFLLLRDTSFNEVVHIEPKPGVDELQGLLSGFLRYQLERDIKSERFLGI